MERKRFMKAQARKDQGWVAGEMSVQAVHINPRKRTKIPEQRAELV